MNTEQWRSMRPIVETVLPPGNRNDRLDGMDEEQKRGSLTTQGALSTVAWGYWDHAVAAFNRWGVLLHVILVTFCFGESALPWQLSITLASVLIALTLRNAWTYRYVRTYWDSLTDGIVAGIFVLASRALAGWASPSLALPMADLYRGSLVCLPLMVILQMALLPKPDMPHAAYVGSNMTGEQIFWRTWRLSVLWLLTFLGLVAQNVTDKHHYPPDFIRAMVVALFGMWFAAQTGSFIGRKWIQMLFSKSRETRLERMYRSLPKGLRKGERGYWRYVILGSTIHLVMGMSLAESLWPWLTGNPTQADVFRAMGSIVAFAAAALSWKYLKEANRAAARAILAEINRSQYSQRSF
jgi:hypothetical protein